MEPIYEQIQKKIIRQYKQRAFFNRVSNTNLTVMVISIIVIIFSLLLWNIKYIIIALVLCFVEYFIDKRCKADLESIGPLINFEYRLLIFINLFSEFQKKKNFLTYFLYNNKFQKSLNKLEDEFPNLNEFPILSISQDLISSFQTFTKIINRIKELNYLKNIEINKTDSLILNSILNKLLSSYDQRDLMSVNKRLNSFLAQLEKFQKPKSELGLFFGKTLGDIFNLFSEAIRIPKLKMPNLLKWIILFLSVYFVYFLLHYLNSLLSEDVLWFKPIFDASQILIPIIISTFGVINLLGLSKT
ncbi:hypothetical protein HYY69_04905 [Candidatus Woesearchaeota archaeon]|nr:hypothetical protein [Candidatus Woesearchaeota archaeon]